MLTAEQKYSFEINAIKRAIRFQHKPLCEYFTSSDKILSASDCMELIDNYTIPLRCIYLMCISHNFTLDVDGFYKLYNEKEQAR